METINFDTKSLNRRVDANINGRNRNGAATLALVQDCMAHAFQSGDWTPLARMVGGSEGAHKSRIKAIIEACGFGVSADKKQPSGFRIAMPEASNLHMVTVLSGYVALGVSHMANVLTTGVEGEVSLPALLPRVEKEYDLAALGRAVLKARSEGVLDEVILGYVRKVLETDSKQLRIAA